MGVHGLWRLLSPQGRRVSLEMLADKRLAVDVSIWLTQFVKAMRDEEGNVLPNAHIVGVLRRVLKLLFYRIKPVLVFDGGTPALKRKTVLRRRQARINQESKLKQAAQKLLLNQLKQARARGKGKGKAAKAAAKAAAFHASSIIDPVEGKDDGGEDGAPPGQPSATQEAAKTEPMGGFHLGPRLVDCAPTQEEVDHVKDEELSALENALVPDDDENFMPEVDPDQPIDVDTLTSLPTGLQQQYMEELQRQSRQRHRERIMPVAANPQSFSEVQMKNFLQRSELAMQIKTLQAQKAAETLRGKGIASEPDKEYILLHDEDKESSTEPSDVSDSEEEEEMAEVDGGGAQPPPALAPEPKVKAVPPPPPPLKYAAPGQRVVVGTMDSDSDDDDGDCGEGVEVAPPPAKIRPPPGPAVVPGQRVVVGMMDSDSDDDDGEGVALAAQLPPRRAPPLAPPAPGGVRSSLAEDPILGSMVVSEAAVRSDAPSRAVVDTESGPAIHFNIRLGDVKPDSLFPEDWFRTEPDVVPPPAPPAPPRPAARPPPPRHEPPAPRAVVVDVDEDSDVAEGDVDAEDNDEDLQTALQASLTQDTELQAALAASLAPAPAVVDLVEDGNPPAPPPIAVDDAAYAPRTSQLVLQEALSTADHLTSWAGKAMRRELQRQGLSQLTQPSPEPKAPSSAEPSPAKPPAPQAPTPPKEAPPTPENQGPDPGPASEPAAGAGAGVPQEVADLGDERTLEELELEEQQLSMQAKKAARDAETLSDGMRDDVVELLELLGVPYLMAPMEAEAQCAALEQLGLVEGIVTDDSDAFLFGAQTVYKNIFEDRKFVEAYHMQDVSAALGLGRDDLVRMALLLGSDYTDGVKGIGIVNASEVLRAFQDDAALRDFRDWVNTVDEDDLKDAKSRKRKKGQQEVTGGAKERFKSTHRTQRMKWNVPSNFPNRHVIEAYTRPTVDKSQAEFEFVKVNGAALRKFCTDKLGWAPTRADDLIKPVEDVQAERRTQRLMDSYVMRYSDNVLAASIRSKRLKAAVKGLAKAGPVRGAVGSPPPATGAAPTGLAFADMGGFLAGDEEGEGETEVGGGKRPRVDCVE